MKLYNKEFTRSELSAYIGDTSQLFGIKNGELTEGRAKGTQFCDIKTGTGFEFTVLPDRAMDIAQLSYKGTPLSFISKSGITNPKYYTVYAAEWGRTFFGGALTTCGLMNTGARDEESGEPQHGRMTNTPADNFSANAEWDGDEFVMTLKGTMREAVIFAENLSVTRKITAKAGESKLIIEDTIRNDGYVDEEIMLLYHMNFGYPLLSENSELVVPEGSTYIARDEDAQKGVDRALKFEKPQAVYPEQVFFHKIAGDKNGDATVCLKNNEQNIGIYIKYNTNQLPELTQWKTMASQDYTVGIEPGTANPIGRTEAGKTGQLKTIKAQEEFVVKLELGIL